MSQGPKRQGMARDGMRRGALPFGRSLMPRHHVAGSEAVRIDVRKGVGGRSAGLRQANTPKTTALHRGLNPLAAAGMLMVAVASNGTC